MENNLSRAKFSDAFGIPFCRLLSHSARGGRGPAQLLDSSVNIRLLNVQTKIIIGDSQASGILLDVFLLASK